MIKEIQPIIYRDNPRNLYSEEGSIFDYNEEEHRKGTKASFKYRASFIAQEVAKYLEENYGDESFNDIVEHEIYYDSDIEKHADKYFLGYGEMIPLMFQAMREQQEIIEAQSEKINNLELRLSKLEDKILNN
jgi:aromatic ring-opening dioxygenase LigB subunit